MSSPLGEALDGHDHHGPCNHEPATPGRQTLDGRSSLLLWPVRGLAHLITLLLVGLITFYQRVISPGLRPRCRFVPSCSEYAALALRKHGLLKGLGKTIWRLARCQPLCKGGYDEP